MEAIIKSMAPKLQEQLVNLADKIRQEETNVLTLKEGYLKVQGALELLEMLQKEQDKLDKTEIIGEAL